MVAVPHNPTFAEVWARIQTWPPADRRLLARSIMESLQSAQPQSAATQMPSKPAGNLADIIGLWSDVQPQPSDEELDRILEDSIIEKHG